MQLLNEENAVKYVLQQLKKLQGYEWDHIHYLNKNRYSVVSNRERKNIAILMKRELFQSFGIRLGKFGAKGVGDSVNCKHLSEFKRMAVKRIYTVFPDGKIYTIPLDLFLMKSIRWTNKEGTEVRSISIHEFERVNSN
jgi:hypothetical protein